MSTGGEGAGKSLRLRFKGDKVEKKKKPKRKASSSSSSKAREAGDESDAGVVDGEEQAWVPVERLTDLAGPAFLVQSVSDSAGSSKLVCLALEPTRGRIEAQEVSDPNSFRISSEEDAKRASLLDLDGAEVVSGAEVGIGAHPSIDTAEPSSVTQVWVCTRVPDTPSDRPRFTLRSSQSRFLAGERGGGVSAASEARGPLEEWTLIAQGRRRDFALVNAHGQLLSTEARGEGGGRLAVRCEGDEKQVSPAATWQMRVQWKHRHEARKRERGVAPLRERDPMMKRLKTGTS